MKLFKSPHNFRSYPLAKKCNNCISSFSNKLHIKRSISQGHESHVPFTHEQRISSEESIKRSREFYELMKSRRSIRFFSEESVPIEVIENVIRTAGTAPSGANKQPWTFVVVKDQDVKDRIREAAEEEEKINYGADGLPARMGPTWIKDLQQLGTTWEKPFLSIAPYLIVVFKQMYTVSPDGKKEGNYYQSESVGIATGMLISAIHNAGLVTLTHTPSPMNFLRDLLQRPANEKPFVLLPVGYPAKDAMVPKISKKTLDQIMIVV